MTSGQQPLAFTPAASAARARSAARSGGGDLGELYGELSGRVKRIVRGDVRAPDPVIEDACQFAWSRLVDHRERVNADKVLSWLVTTAVHEAYKLIRRDDRELSLDAVLEHGEESWIDVRSPPPDELLEQREQLDAIRALPERQQRLLWLHGLGLSYTEMATHTGCTTRTVERQLLRAKHRMRRTEDE
ncbi:MAG: sigma-70 family RNA polymerase sigma factor [Solirubrobacteraceae bacterium]